MDVDHLLDDPLVRFLFIVGWFIFALVEMLPVLAAILVATLFVTARPSARATWRRPDGRAAGLLALPYLGLALGTEFVASQIGAGPDHQHIWRMEEGTYPVTLGVLLLSALALGMATERLRPFGSWVTAVVVLWLCLAASVVVTLSSYPFAQPPCPPRSPATEP